MNRLIALATVWAVALAAPIPVTITYYWLVPAQTDSTPLVGSCGHVTKYKTSGWKLVALSRDLFYDEHGHKRCGEYLYIRLTSGEVIHGIVWDTMAPRFTHAVDILFPTGKRAAWGKATGVVEFIEGY